MLYASLASQLCTVPSFRHATMKRIPTLLFRLDREPNWWPLPEKRDVQKGVWFLLKQMKGMGTICLWKPIWPLTQKNKRLTVLRGHHAVMRDGGAASKCTCIQHGRQGGLSVPCAASDFADLQVWMLCPTVSVHITDLDCAQKLKYSTVYSVYCHSRS